MASSVPIVFDCDGQSLVGIFEVAEAARKRGVIVVVGGPQYRVGSHRQFTLLSRDLADAGYTTLRFDQRGVGDSEGESTFESIGPDIGAAIDVFVSRHPHIDEIVLWGLCDAASAIMMAAPTDPRITGIVVLNPWVRSDQTLAQSYVSSYYVRRLVSANFWRRLVSGEVRVVASIRDFFRNLRLAHTSAAARGDDEGGRSSDGDFRTRMMRGLRDFPGRTLIILSGKDITADEFRTYVGQDRGHRRVMQDSRIQVMDFPDADHTFSTAAWRAQVAAWTVGWLDSW